MENKIRNQYIQCAYFSFLFKGPVQTSIKLTKIQNCSQHLYTVYTDVKVDDVDVDLKVNLNIFMLKKKNYNYI